MILRLSDPIAVKMLNLEPKAMLGKVEQEEWQKSIH
jgi:hypothetical protein